MKIQVDIDNKTITIIDDVNLGDLIRSLSKLFPEEDWNKFTLLHRNMHTPPYHNPDINFPWMQNPITTYGGSGTTTIQHYPGTFTLQGTNTTQQTLLKSVHNIELTE